MGLDTFVIVMTDARSFYFYSVYINAYILDSYIRLR